MAKPSPPTFHGFQPPKPNMLVQSGTKVLIKGLTSEKGRQLNGRYGTALKFHGGQGGRWEVQVHDADNSQKEHEDASGEQTEAAAGESKSSKPVLIKIFNLEAVLESDEFIFNILRRDDPSWMAVSEGGRWLLKAGTTLGTPALLLLDDPTRDGFDPERVRLAAQRMGVSDFFIRELLSPNLYVADDENDGVEHAA